MLNFYVFVSIFLAIIFVILGLIVATRNFNSTINRLYLSLSFFIAGWLVTNYIGGDPNFNYNTSLIANRLIFFFGILSVLSLVFFIKNLLSIKTTKLWELLFSVNLIFAFLSAVTPLIVEDVMLENDTYVIKFGILSSAYFIIFLIDLFILGYISIKGMRSTTGRLNSQLRIILNSLAIFLGIVFITNGLIPFIFGYYGLANTGALLSSVLVFGVGYSIVKHKLFDIRLVLARSLAYLLSIGVITSIIALLIFVLSESVRDTQISETVQSLIYVAVTLILVLSYPSLKKFFDKVTNSLFYRDAYDAEQFIGQLNQVVVTDIEIYSLLRKVVSVIEKNLKVTYCAFATVNHDGGVVLVSDDPDERQDLTKLDIKLLKEINDHRQIVVTDYLDEQKDIKLKQHLSDLDLGAVVSLVSKKSNEPQQFTKVYMVLGLKKSGNPFTSQDVRVLGIISDSLALAIQNALRFEEISRFNITLQEKIDEATRELKRTNEKLKALDEAKDEFISMASHQLRTPLTSVKGYVSMVLEGDTGAIKEDQRKLLQQAFDSSQRMVYLIADLLNVSRLRTGKFVIENKPTNLIEVVQGEVDQLKETASNKQITLSYEKPDKIPEMMLDETKIRQVIMNFLDNAIYYTPSGGEVKVALKKVGESVEYTVTDTGVGVPKSEQHHLFTKFFRAGNARKMRPDGTGLGLYMAQKVVVAQGGAIIFNSEEGKGSTFGFKFPLKPNPTNQPITDNGEEE